MYLKLVVSHKRIKSNSFGITFYFQINYLTDQRQEAGKVSQHEEICLTTTPLLIETHTGYPCLIPMLDTHTRYPHKIPMLDTHTWYPCLILIQDTRFHWNPRKMPTLETHVWHPHKIPMLENQPKQEQSTWQQQCLKTSPTEFPSPVGFKQMVLLRTALPTFSKGRVSNSPSSSSVRQFSLSPSSWWRSSPTCWWSPACSSTGSWEASTTTSWSALPSPTSLLHASPWPSMRLRSFLAGNSLTHFPMIIKVCKDNYTRINFRFRT